MLKPTSVKRIFGRELQIQKYGERRPKCVGTVLNDMPWRERNTSERHLYPVECAVHEKVDEHYKISPRHTHHQRVQCVIRCEWVNHEKELTAHLAKMSVSRTVCVLTHAE